MATTFTSTNLDSLASLAPENPDSLLLGQDPSINRIAHHTERAAQVECTVLITGETGTGKEVWARLLHRLGPRAGKPFVPVNCAALTATLAESQLFGHEKGAFTGAAGASLGVFRAAHGGVVFLDEIGDMPMELQPKLLRVLQEGEVTPVGSSHPQHVDVQVVTATNRNLERDVEEGRFREDLYYRLNLVELRMPPLRDRVEDIPHFIDFFSKKYAARYDQPVWVPSPETLRRFCEYRWPGNVRQLGFVIEQSYVLQCEPILPGVPETTGRNLNLPFTNLGRLREVAVEQALRTTSGHKGRAAELLGVHPNTLTRILAQLDEGE
ncbi:sigma-54 interaction domain-containing protein [Bythopirellula polymerisocia]|uniref:Transcriptional regulatory protein QseF n=1 Tax=Bythopirellula polymerisocia TaxID=2528003 RepID=A0A5C6CQF1_9BACT|nr:sigma-54 dependent transcriptional regulator [Bythopirellula polymerisocia]TWU25734.1 Transcriptional regulatory protein QseF [Bythopirellula polymerisocia]